MSGERPGQAHGNRRPLLQKAVLVEAFALVEFPRKEALIKVGVQVPFRCDDAGAMARHGHQRHRQLLADEQGTRNGRLLPDGGIQHDQGREQIGNGDSLQNAGVMHIGKIESQQSVLNQPQEEQ